MLLNNMINNNDCLLVLMHVSIAYLEIKINEMVEEASYTQIIIRKHLGLHEFSKVILPWKEERKKMNDIDLAYLTQKPKINLNTTYL